MMNDNLIVLKSAYGKTYDQTYHIMPCVDPETGLYPDHIRRRDPNTKQLILSDADKTAMSKGKIFLASDVAIEVKHGTTFDLNNPLQKAQWEAIKNSHLIAMNRLEKDEKGKYKIDGGESFIDKTGMVKASIGLADLYVETPGLLSKNRVTERQLRLKALNLIDGDTFEGMLTKCRLLDKDMSRATADDVIDWLQTQAEKYPEKIIDLYNGKTAAARLLIAEATDVKKAVIKKIDGLYYYGDYMLANTLDKLVEFVMNPENDIVVEAIKKETFPNLEKKTTKK